MNCKKHCYFFVLHYAVHSSLLQFDIDVCVCVYMDNLCWSTYVLPVCTNAVVWLGTVCMLSVVNCAITMQECRYMLMAFVFSYQIDMKMQF